MSALRGAVLAIAVGLAALWVLWRFARGKPTVARSALLLRAVTLSASLVVLLSPGSRATAQQAPARAGAASADFPRELTPSGLVIQASVAQSRELGDARLALDRALDPTVDPRTRASAFAAAASACRELAAEPDGHQLGPALEAFVAREAAGRPPTRAELEALLDAAEHAPTYDTWLAAQVWRRAGDVAMSGNARITLMKRLARHLRVAEALTRASQEVGPPTFHPWRMMSMRPRDYVGIEVPPGFAAAAARIYASMTAPAWERDGAIALRVVSGEARLHHPRTVEHLAANAPLRLGRLDVLEAGTAPLIVSHPRLGTITLAPGSFVDARGLHARIDPAQRVVLANLIAAGARGDPPSLAALEGALPLAHDAIRAELTAHPAGPGAARLRTLLALFDE